MMKKMKKDDKTEKKDEKGYLKKTKKY